MPLRRWKRFVRKERDYNESKTNIIQARDKEQENTSEYFEGEADGFKTAIEIVKEGGIC